MSSTSYVYGSLQSCTPAQQAKAAPVERFHLYKCLREEELSALRSLVRVFAMHGQQNPQLSAKVQERMLTDLREAFCVSSEVLAAETNLAAQDPVVKAVASASVPTLRDIHQDAFNDVSLPDWIDADIDAEDDDVTLVHRVAAPVAGGAGGTMRRAPGAHPRSAAVMATGAAAARVDPEEALSRKYKEARKRVDALVTEYVKATEDATRTALRAKLEKERSELATLKLDIEAALTE